MATLPNYGQDTACSNDIPLRDAQVTGLTLIGNAIYRRLFTPRGALGIVGDDENYGLNLLSMVNDTGLDSAVAKWESAIAQECMKDERVLYAIASVSVDVPTGQTSINIDITLSDEQTFTLVVGISNLTASLVSLVV